MSNKLLDSVQHHGFIAATSVAMFVHSTWTFNTLFAGEQPHLDGSPMGVVNYMLWVLPGALIALAIDVGQIQTAINIKRAQGWRQKAPLGFTFIVLAFAGYYLQWFHMVHHMPSLALGDGVAPTHMPLVISLVGWAVWLVPSLLPLSTILYTISNSGSPDVVSVSPPSVDLDKVSVVDHAPLPSMSWSYTNVEDDFDPEDDDTEPIEVPVSGGYGQLDTSPEAQSERAKKPRRRKGNGSVK